MDKLIEYIKSEREAGTSDDAIKSTLGEVGWDSDSIKQGFEAVSNNNDGNTSSKSSSGDSSLSSQNLSLGIKGDGVGGEEVESQGANPSPEESRVGQEQVTQNEKPQPQPQTASKGNPKSSDKSAGSVASEGPVKKDSLGKTVALTVLGALIAAMLGAGGVIAYMAMFSDRM